MRANRTGTTGLLSAITLLSILAYASSAYAEDDRGEREGKRFGMHGGQTISARMLERLDLDDMQRQTVNNILEAAKPELDALRDRKRSNSEALSALDPADVNYAVELETISAENGRLANEGTVLQARVRAEVHAVLSDEQRAELERAKNSRKERGGNRKRSRNHTESES